MEVPATVADACTLPTVEQPLRIAEWDAVFTEVVAVERSGTGHGRLVFTATPELEDRLRDLSQREAACCSFFDFMVDARADVSGRSVLTLDIEVPESRLDVLDAFVRWADDVRASRREVRT